MNVEFLFDYHTQTLEHGFEKPLRIEETIQAAIKGSLSAICLTDHYPLPSGFIDPTEEKDCAMPMSWYEDYQDQVTELIAKYRQEIRICRGAEFDWLPGYAGWTTKEIKRWPFDYVIGAVHFLGEIKNEKGRRNFLLDYREDEFLNGVRYFGGIRPLIEKYFGEVRAMILSGLFDCVGHIDLIKKYNDGSLFSEADGWYIEVVLETLDAIAESEMILEINTSGWDKKCGFAYPSLWILEEAKKRNISLTIGSDGHTPETIGRNLEKAVLLAKKAGYKKLMKFRQRKKMEVTI